MKRVLGIVLLVLTLASSAVFTATADDYSSLPVSEQQALDDLKALIGSYLYYRTENGHVVGTLDLRGNNLTSLPESIGNLTNLEFLFLDYNKLTSLPSSIGNLTNLRSLYLGGNN
ncbi:MAG: leucine-rich repeat domain-containing protein, partial [Abditibacteriota bacterium]|nr:leucine-rich repeat domain-containing protein [Abditibacteriota bacterium]